MHCVPSSRAYQKPPPRPPSCLGVAVAIWSILQLLTGLALVGCGVWGMVDPAPLQPYQDLWMEVLLFDGRVVVMAGGAILTLLSLLSLTGVLTSRKLLLEVPDVLSS